MSYWVTSPSFHDNRSSHSWDTAFSKFDLENPKVKLKAQDHIVGPTSYQLTSLFSMFIDPPIPEIQLFKNLTVKIWRLKSKVKVMGEVKVQSHKVCPISYRFISLFFHVNQPSYSCNMFFQHLTLKIQGQGHKPMMLHNYRLRLFHRTLNGVNPSSGFRDMCSTKSGPQWHLILQVLLSIGKLIWGKCKWANLL